MRRTKRIEPTQIINPLLTAAKLRDLTQTYIRHTIKRPIRSESNLDKRLTLKSRIRSSPSDFFYIYCRQVIPQIEERIELQLLEKFKSTLASQLEKNEVDKAYYQRKDNLAKIPEREDPDQPEPKKAKVILSKDKYYKVIQSIHGDGISYHTYQDIGRYTVFPKAMVDRMFPSVMFGRYKQEEYDINETFGIQTREEALRITNDMARLTLPSERNIDYLKISSMTNSEVKDEILKDEQNYVAIFQDMSLSLLDYIKSLPSKESKEVKQLFDSPGVFDGFVNILTLELQKSPIRPYICDLKGRKQIIKQFIAHIQKLSEELKFKFHEFSQIIEKMPIINLNLHKNILSDKMRELQKFDQIQYKMYLNGYHKKCYHHWRPEDIRRVELGKGEFKGFNTGGLLWGEKGCGKSQILAYLTTWAHENKWVNFTIANCSEFVDQTHNIERMNNGLYVQFSLAQRIIQDLKIQNEQLFSEMKVKKRYYGQFDITGNRIKDGDPCPRTWDPLRQCWSDDWKQYLYDSELRFFEQRYKELDYTLKDKCPAPKTLLDIAEAGIADPNLATNAIAELLEQCYNQDKRHVLIALDGYNTWLNPTSYRSFRYKNDGDLKGQIPPKDIALVRLLMKFDGHFLRQGVKYATTTHYTTFNHIMTPEMVDWFDGYSHKVPNLTLNEFRNFINYKNITNWTPDIYQEWEIEKYFMESQGNYSAWHQTYYKYSNIYMNSSL